MTIGGIINALVFCKERNKNLFSSREVEALDCACTILERCFNRRSTIGEAISVYNDNDGDDSIASIYWTKADIGEALSQRGFEADDDNIDIILNYPNLAKHIEGECIIAGWDAIYDAIKNSKDLLLAMQTTND